MIKPQSVWMIAAAFFAGALAAQAIPPNTQLPVKVDMQFNWNIRLVTPQQMCPGACAPWYVYFPYDCHPKANSEAGRFPNWPQPFPKQNETQKEARANGVVQTSVSNYLSPAQRAIPRGPSYWYRD